MGEKILKSGIDILDDVAWGTHFCQFYHTREDLIDILVPYFKAGLENNEFCMWITSEPFSEKDAKKAMRMAVPHLDRYMKRGQMEIIPYEEWYLKEGTFNFQRVLDGWIEKHDQALARGYDGIRITGNTAWLEERDWRNFAAYEENISKVIGKYKMMVICSYSLDKCGASEVMDVTSNHQFALIRREGKWELIESSERKQAKQTLRESEENYRQLTESISDVFFEMDKDLRYTYWNKASEKLTGISAKDAIGKSLSELFPDALHTKKAERVYLDVLRTQQPQTFVNEYQLGGKDFFFDISAYPSKRGLSVFVKDITGRMQTEKELREKEEFNFALFQHNPIQTIVVDRGGRVLKANMAKRKSGDKLPNIGDVLYKDYAAKHEIDMHAELMECIRSDKAKRFPELKYDDKFLNISIAPFPQGAIITSLDITERKQAEEALRKSEGKYRSLFDNMLEGFAYCKIIVDKNNKPVDFEYIEVNDAFEKLTGLKKEQVTGKRATEAIPGIKKAHPELFKIYGKVAMTGKPANFDIYFEPLRIWLSISVYGPKRGYFVTIFDNITARKKAEDALRESEERYRAIFNQAAVSNVLVDGETGDLVEFNEKTYENLGYTREEFKKLKIPDFEAIEPAEKVAKHIKKIIRDGSDMFETKHRTKGGKIRDILVSSRAISIEGRDFIQSMWSDITERKQAEEALQKSEQQSRISLETLLDGFAIFSAIRNKAGRIVDFRYEYINKSGCQLNKRTYKEQVGHTLLELLPAHKDTGLLHEYTQVVETGKPLVRESLLYEDTFGVNRRLSRAFDFKATKLGDGFAVTWRDVTERKLAEREIKNSQSQLRNLTAHLQSVREEERTLIAREMHDELGQALTAMKMDLSWLDKRLPKDQRSLLEKTKAMSKLADATLQTIKKISTELRPELLDDLGLPAAIEWQAEEFQTRTGIKCEITVDPEDIILDKDRSTAVFRIFQETLTNVARHAKATRIKVSLKEKAGKIELKVRDNGKGITEEQVSNPKSFGLIGIKERAYYLGGKVVIKGLQDIGTTLTIRIPLPQKGKTK